MIFSSGFLGSLLTRSRSWVIKFSENHLLLDNGGSKPVAIAYPTVTEVRVTPGKLWANIQILTQAKTFNLDGISNRKGYRIQLALSIKLLSDALAEFLTCSKYISQRDITLWIEQQKSLDRDFINTALSALNRPYAHPGVITKELNADLESLLNVLSGKSDLIKKRNQKFVESELAEYKPFFDTVEKTPLTREQRGASVVMEDRNLLVAAAGSGKTSTVVGKIGYALSKGLVKPEEILVLAFNNAAAKELSERIQDRLPDFLDGQKIKVKTFHALGLEIIAQSTGEKPSISNSAGGNEFTDGKLMTELVEGLQASDADFLVRWQQFLTLCRLPAQDPARFTSIEDWNSYVRATGDYQKETKKYGYLNLNKELMKSQGELAIANWLIMNGVNFIYEKPYKYQTANKEFRQYKPDFYFPEIDCYLEHYALDHQGNPPVAFGDKYRASMEWKRQLHADKGTDVFETTFDEFISGKLFGKLELDLTKRGVQLKPLNPEEILELINQSQLIADLSKLLRTFIKHVKSNELDATTLASRAEADAFPLRASLFVQIAGKVKSGYENKLQQQGDVDFEDLIVNAANHAADGEYKHSFRLLLVDEFQDISRARAKLLLSLLKVAPDCKLFAVGDDWQAIYRFAGSDIGIFTSFPKLFGNTATNYLSQTFRSNQGIANIAADFVQRNPAQMKKSVTALDTTTTNVISIRQYARLDDIENLISGALDELVGEVEEGSKRSVYILGRYKHQRPKGMLGFQNKYSETLTIEFKTIHSSKGLQADYVILVGLHAGKQAFPSEIADDPLLQLVMPDPERYPHAEERRLFYVAMTRARHRVYLLGGRGSPSSFLNEVMFRRDVMLSYTEVLGKEIADRYLALPPDGKDRCPICGVGQMEQKNGKYGLFLGCSEFPKCDHTQNLEHPAPQNNS